MTRPRGGVRAGRSDGGGPDRGATTASQAEIVDRLAGLHGLDRVPRRELGWLVGHGRLERYEAGHVIAPKGRRVEYLWVILSGRISVRVDRGAGPRKVITWLPGDVSGMLPYSRMKAPPGDNYLEERSEVLALHESHFQEMVHQCPEFTAHTVHLMLDRARSFKASDLQGEKMMALGKLAAGLAHELNNPASAAVRGASLLREGLSTTDDALSRLAGAGLTGRQLMAIEGLRAACLVEPSQDLLTPIERADREDAILDWLERHRADPALAGPLADTSATLATLDSLAEIVVEPETLDAALGWIANRCSIHSLASHIESAVSRIHEIVAAVKRFTYMDRIAVPEAVDVETGLRDTLTMMASRVRAKNATVSLDIDPDVPAVQAVGGELNQVWLNLLDNALDAIAEGGTVRITAGREIDRVVVRIVDNGPGIPDDALPLIFDPFFTTKPPGQGTGLGLDVTRRLLQGFRGDISVVSNPGATEFRVGLAISDRPGPDGAGAL